MNQDLNDLYYYVQVVEHGGFAPAGRALGMPKSKLSRRVSMLEERLGVCLIQRSSRRFTVTELGKAYYARCQAVLEAAAEAQAIIESSHAAPCGTVRLACPIALLHAHVGRMLVDFAVQYPEVKVQVVGMNRPVDVIAEGLDIAIRMHQPPLGDSDLVMRVLAHSAQCLVATPAAIARFGTPETAQDLASWPSLGYGPPVEEHAWMLTNPDGVETIQRHTPKFVSSDMYTLVQAALAGIGAAQLPVMMVRDQLSQGSLICLLPAWTLRQRIIHAVFPTRRGLVSSVRVLLDHLAARFAEVSAR